MRTIYHEFESLDHLLSTRLLPGGSEHPLRFVLFGGTGAVGGATVLELCRVILDSERFRDQPWSGEIFVTGPSDKEISNFASRLYLALERETTIEKIEPRRHYRIGGRIDLRFSLLHLTLPQDLREHVLATRERDGEAFDVEAVLEAYFAAQPRPFLRFVEDLDTDLLHAVVVAIPLPSVATYTLDTIDRLAAELEIDHAVAKRIKSSFLDTFIHGLAVIQQRYARHVLMAHTTAVGGMYRVDGGRAEIRLGFAHSALGKKLVDKKYFADELTQLYIDHGFQVLVTAAAIGIDAVDFHTHLPLDRGVGHALRRAISSSTDAADVESSATPLVDPGDLDKGDILLYPFRALDLNPDADTEATPLSFSDGKELIFEAAIRSGENGIFSVANCVALYNVMKVAIPEELAMVLVRYAFFGPERRRGWFDDKVCYYTETDNSHFALRILDSYPRLQRAHLGAFAVQAYQALGSSTHQARLHELGLLMLALRLRELRQHFGQISEADLLDGLADLDLFFWERTRIPTWEDLAELEVDELADLLGQLCEVETMEDAGQVLGYDPRAHGIRERGRERFLSRLATRIGRYVQTITSLGIPILYRSTDASEGDRLLVGPYAAPLDRAVTSTIDVDASFRRLAESCGVSREAARDWLIVNNGFIDLRPHALVGAAKEPGPHLSEAVRTFESAEEIGPWLDALPVGTYFTTCGLVALTYRLRCLYEKVSQRRVRLGTYETWKHLFPQDTEGRHLLSPGLIETVRMYSEGLGKVTGTETLWPGWGY